MKIIRGYDEVSDSITLTTKIAKEEIERLPATDKLLFKKLVVDGSNADLIGAMQIIERYRSTKDFLERLKTDRALKVGMLAVWAVSFIIGCVVAMTLMENGYRGIGGLVVVSTIYFSSLYFDRFKLL